MGKKQLSVAQMNDVKQYGTVYHDEEWPHGLSCIKCSKILVDGDRYATVLDSFIDDIPVTIIICLECALSEARDE
jgi:RNase P subunit RPR2